MPKKRIEILLSIVSKLGNVNIQKLKEDFSERLLIQKTAYLLQVFDLNLGYRYTWYLHGPYSKELTTDIYNINTSLKVVEIHFTDEFFKNKFQKLLDFLSDKNKDPRWLELITSVHFLRHLNKPKEEILKIITIEKNFTEDDFNHAWSYLKSNSLISD